MKKIPAGRKRPRHPAWGKIALIALLMAGLAAAWRFTPLAEFLAPHRITGWARALRQVAWAPLIVVFAYTPAALLMFPRPLLTLVAVIAFGAWLGMAYSIAGVMVAAFAS